MKHEGAPSASADVAVKIARTFVELRTSHGETQKHLAGRLGMTESMISRLESGTHLPSIATLCRVADAFNRRLGIVFHEHEHTHVDGTQHTHPHRHDDLDHAHDHEGR
jgi:transcriptional regulator with XRE-family HTH domain